MLNKRPDKDNRKEQRQSTDYDRFGTFSFKEYGQQRGKFEKPANDSFANKLGVDIIPHDKMKQTNAEPYNRSRLIICFAVLVFLMVVLIFRMGYWQIIKSEDLKEKAISMQKVDTEIEPVRGTIYDSRMSTLAETVTEYELYGYTQYLYKTQSKTEAERNTVVSELAKLTGEDSKSIKKKLESDDNLVLLASGLTKAQVDKAKKLWGSNVQVKTKVARYYPNGAFASQLLGGVNSENVGRTGLEYEYNSILAGIKGRTVRTTDNQGNTVANGKSKTYQAQDGCSLVTSIDSVIQHYVEDAVEKGMRRTGADSITCIVMEPKTGNVLAMAQTPEYDPNNSTRPSDENEYKAFKNLSNEKQSEYLSDMWTIDAVSDIYEPGSTFKLIAAASSLELGTTNKDSRYYCGGAINVNGTRLGCLGNHGTQDIKVAVGNSCNAALARVALNMGAKSYYNYIDLFGYNDKTGIDLPGETNSIVKNPDGMGAVDLATTGYGQGIAITPIQMLCAVNSLGNGGKLMKPKVVTKIVDKDGKTVEKIKDTVVRQVVSEETADEMCDIMEYYVSDAGGPSAYVDGYRVGGKTGTANVASNGGYSSKKDCSFVAMAPMDDPVISMLVIVHHPTKTEYGDSSAGPIVKDIMEKSLQYLGVEREYTKSEKSKAEKNKVRVPNVTGNDSKKAIETLKKKKLKYEIMPESTKKKSFKVVDQYPKAGTKVDKKTVVYLYSE
ncbi:MAG: PASTA domain-containing protein [Clostridiales bacterium]|nr:PASTA domain-containing protein [Candidatus Crickella caballi]